MTATHGVGTYGNAVGVVTPLDHKMAHLGLIVKTAANTIRPGLFWDGNTTIVSGKANMSYDVRALTAVTSRGATAGAVLLTNDAVFNVVTTAAPGSNSRYDHVYLWPREFSIDGTDSNPVIGVVNGTAAASPTVPSLAAFPGAISLATILVPAGVTATNSGTTIAQTAPFTALDGGTVVARTTAERDLYLPAAADTKALCWVLADGITYRWNGTAWKKTDLVYKATFSGATTCIVDAVFIAGKNYRVAVVADSAVGAGDPVLQFRRAGATLASGTDHSWDKSQISAGTRADTGSTSAGSINVGRLTATGGSTRFEVMRPGSSAFTELIAGSASDSAFVSTFAGARIVADIVDGFIITHTSNVAGTVWVYEMAG